MAAGRPYISDIYVDIFGSVVQAKALLHITGSGNILKLTHKCSQEIEMSRTLVTPVPVFVC